MVHFYPTLVHIVFDYVSGKLANITHPGTKVYHKVEKMVLADAQETQRRTQSREPTSAKFRARGTTSTQKQFRAIMKDFPAMMLAACGGSNLSQCRWEAYMKKFILKFP